MSAQKRKLDEEFEKISKIGQGSYGVVYKVRSRKSNDIVALKRVKIDDLKIDGLSEGIPSSSLREIAALKNLRHPNVVELLDIRHSGTSINLVFEYLNRDLKMALEETANGLPERLVKSYLFQLLKGIAFCHSQRILHRDLKLQNLLVNRDGTIKLADFGLARSVTLPVRIYTKEVVTLWYRAPEILLGSELYGPAIDVWSLGCIFYEMLTKKVLFPGDSEIDQLFKIFQKLGTPNESQWEGLTRLPNYKPIFPNWPPQDLDKLLGKFSSAADLLKRMLVYDPFRRISAQNAMKHPYLDLLNKRTTLRNIQDPSSRKVRA